MVVVALTGARGGQLAQLLRDTDVHICVPSDVPARMYPAVLALRPRAS